MSSGPEHYERQTTVDSRGAEREPGIFSKTIRLARFDITVEAAIDLSLWAIPMSVLVSGDEMAISVLCLHVMVDW